MAVLPNPFNAHMVEPLSPSNALPVSDDKGHVVMITGSEFKPSKNNPNNGFLELMLSIIDGEHKGQSGAYRINLFNENPQTVEIASRQLSAVCHVCNQMMVSDSSQLHNIPFRVIVGLQKKQKPDDPDYTEVKGVLDVQGNKPKAAGTAPGSPAPMPQQPQAAPTAPWGNTQQVAPPQPQQPAFQPPATAPAAGAPPWAR